MLSRVEHEFFFYKLGARVTEDGSNQVTAKKGDGIR